MTQLKGSWGTINLVTLHLQVSVLNLAIQTDLYNTNYLNMLKFEFEELKRFIGLLKIQ